LKKTLSPQISYELADHATDDALTKAEIDVLRLIAAGEMRPMGLRAVEAAQASGEWERAYTVQRPLPPPEDLKAAIRRSPAARATRDRLSRTRWDRWMSWLDGTEGRTRARRLNAIMKALETRDFAAVDAAAKRATQRKS